MGAWVAQPVKCLPFTQVMILGSWDQVQYWAPWSPESLLLPLLVLSHSLLFCQVNKMFFKK